MTTNGYPYNAPFESQFDEARAQEFVILRLLRGVHTCELVSVLAVRPTTGKVGFLDVMPLIQERDTAGVLLPQSPIYNVPYLRYQGGSSAVILDPAVGDNGIALFARQDITSIKASLAPGAPPTERRHSTADALYLGGVLNPDATQVVRFHPNAEGIDITTPGDLNLTAGGAINITAGGNVTVTGAQLVLNIPVLFNQGAKSTPTAANSFVFSSPIVAPDFIDGNGVKHATHVHSAPGGTTSKPTN